MSKNGLIEDRPNPKANIAILVPPHIFFINAFRTVAEHLPNAEFVPDFSAVIRKDTYPEGYKTTVRQKLIDEKVHWRDLEFSNRTAPEFFDKYALLVAPFHVGLLAKPYNRNKKKVRICYSNAKDSWVFGLKNAYFDLILCPGRYAKENFSVYSARTVAIGEPKLDGLFRVTKDRQSIGKELGLTIDAKKTLLYLPTWGSLSSLPIAVPALISLTDQFNVIVKVHHVTMLYETSEVEKIRGSSVMLLDDRANIVDALQLADVVMSDNSGSIFDALVAEKPLILIDTISEKEDFFIERPFHGFRNSKPAGVDTHADSIEQVIKRPDQQIAPVIRVLRKKILDPVEVQNAFQHINDPAYLERQKKIVENLFAYRDGRSGERAAVEITKLLYESGHTRDKTLERLVDEFEHRISTVVQTNATLQESQRNAKLEALEKIKQLSFPARMRALRELLKEYF